MPRRFASWTGWSWFLRSRVTRPRLPTVRHTRGLRMTAQRAIWSASVRCRYQVMSVCQCNSCNTLPHRLGAVGSGTPATHCHTAWGQWAVQLLQRTALLHGGIGLQCTAPLPGGSGQWNSCNSLPHCLGVVGNGTPATHCHTAWGSGQWNSCNALPYCMGAVGSGTPVMHCLTAWGQWAVELVQRTATPPGGSGHWNSHNTLPHCLGAKGSGTPATHSHTAWGQWAVELPQYTASLPGGKGQWNSCNALPHRLGALGSATAAMRCSTAWGQWAVELL